MTIPSAYNMLDARTTYYVDGVKTLRLIGGCELDIYDKIVQPVRTVALACPRMDYIRLWPLQVEQVWMSSGLAAPTPCELVVHGDGRGRGDVQRVEAGRHVDAQAVVGQFARLGRDARALRAEQERGPAA